MGNVWTFWFRNGIITIRFIDVLICFGHWFNLGNFCLRFSFENDRHPFLFLRIWRIFIMVISFLGLPGSSLRVAQQQHGVSWVGWCDGVGVWSNPLCSHSNLSWGWVWLWQYLASRSKYYHDDRIKEVFVLGISGLHLKRMTCASFLPGKLWQNTGKRSCW